MSATSFAADSAAAAAAASSKVMTAAEYSDQVAAWLQMAYNSQMMALSRFHCLKNTMQITKVLHILRFPHLPGVPSGVCGAATAPVILIRTATTEIIR